MSWWGDSEDGLESTRLKTFWRIEIGAYPSNSTRTEESLNIGNVGRVREKVRKSKEEKPTELGDQVSWKRRKYRKLISRKGA